MHKKIYFGDKPLFVADSPTEETKRYAGDKRTLVAETLDKAAIQNLIRKMEQPETLAGILIHPSFDTLWETVSQEFTLIQAAGGLVYAGEKEMLLIFRRGKWDLPKGKLDEGESLETCAVREVTEETGLQNIILKNRFALPGIPITKEACIY